MSIINVESQYMSGWVTRAHHQHRLPIDFTTYRQLGFCVSVCLSVCAWEYVWMCFWVYIFMLLCMGMLVPVCWCVCDCPCVRRSYGFRASAGDRPWSAVCFRHNRARLQFIASYVALLAVLKFMYQRNSVPALLSCELSLGVFWHPVTTMGILTGGGVGIRLFVWHAFS